MNANYPNKYIRSEIYDRLHNADINGTTFPVFTERATVSNSKNYYLISTQLNTQTFNKCGNGWDNSTELQVIVRRRKNEGTKLLLDDAVQEALTELDDFSLPSTTGLKVNRVELSVDNEIVDERGSEIVYQTIIRMLTSIR